jgi:hypothetical protein
MADTRNNKVSPQEIYDYLMTKPGMTDVKAKGILANIKAESNFDSGIRGDYMIADPTGKLKNKERLVFKKRDGKYYYSKYHPTKARQEVDASLIEGIESTSGGLFQHQGSRYDAMVAQVGDDWETNWKGQIDFALQEREAQNYMNTDFTSVSDSTRAFMLEFEKPANQSEEAVNKRIEAFNSIELNTESDTNPDLQVKPIEIYQDFYGPDVEIRNINGKDFVFVPNNQGGFNQIPIEEANANTRREAPSAPQPPVLDAEGNVVYQPTPEEGDQALVEEQERIRDAEERERQIIAEKRYNDALEYQELKERNRRLRAGYKPEDMPRVFQNEIASNEERIREIEKEYNLTQITDEEYERRRLEAVASIITFDDALEDETEEEIIRNLVGSDLIEETVEIGEEEEEEEEIEQQVEEEVEEVEEEVEQDNEVTPPPTIPTLPTSEIPDDADIRQGVATWEDDDGNIQQARVGEIDEVEQPVTTTETTETDETTETTETDETVNINNTTNQPKNFLDTFGELGNVIGNTLGLVDSIRQGVQSQDDLILAALGKQAYAEANKKIKPLELPGLSNLFRSHLEQSRQLAKKGFSPDEAQKAQAEIDAAYGKGIENAVRGTAGDRAKFLAMSGVLDSQRQSALLDFAAKDAELQRANNANYLKALSFHEEYELNKGKAEQSSALQLALQEKKGASDFAKEVFKQIEQNRRDRALEPIQQYYISKLNNSMQNPYTSPLTTPSITDNN